MNIQWKSTKVYTAFLSMGHAFWKQNIGDRVKLLGSNVLNCCLKITTADLCKIGLTMNYVAKNLAPPRVEPCPSLHYTHPPPPPLRVHLSQRTFQKGTSTDHEENKSTRKRGSFGFKAVKLFFFFVFHVVLKPVGMTRLKPFNSLLKEINTVKKKKSIHADQEIESIHSTDISI